MTELVKAQLGEITAGNNPQEIAGTLTDVQFNPTTLRVQISNRTAGGQQAGAQARQRPGTGEMQVSFDLVFDTADEADSSGEALSVLEKTKIVERFVRPRGARPGQEAPPRVIFKWGSFIVQGVMESANTDLDLFDARGVPLRAKVGVTIKGQDPRWTYTPAPAAPSAGNNAGNMAGRPGSSLPPGTPGTKGNNQSPERIVQAMPGESLAQLASRTGFDPGAWRALAGGLANPLKLELGQEVLMPAAMSKGAASGSNGQGSDPGKTAASLPLVDAGQAGSSGAGSNDGARNAPDLATDPVRKGQAVTMRGGLQGSIAGVKQDAHQQRANGSLSAFGLAGSGAADNLDRPWGAGVPLRPRFGSRLSGAHRDPTQPGWVAQPDSQGMTNTRPKSVQARATTNSKAGCGCRGRSSRPVK